MTIAGARSGSILVAESVIDEMVDLARAALPHEACGVVGGRNGALERLFPLANVAASAERYEVDPVEQAEAYRSMLDAGMECVAVYHSHPATPARPSATDIAEAHDPHVAYVIVSLATQEPSVRAFRIDADTPEEIRIERVEK